ncbi:MAG: aconitate hydratase AcnA [Candidatus Helarchaeota archaeon]
MKEYLDPFGVKDIIKINNKKIKIFKIKKLEEIGIGEVSKLPISIKILLEAVLRQVDNKIITEDEVKLIANWRPGNVEKREIPFIPARLILQDFTGVPAVVDLAAMRSAVKQLGSDPTEINPTINVDLIIDHSIKVDYYGTKDAIIINEKKEFERNLERYMLLRWAQNAFDNFRVVPPGGGIIHQINLEYLSSVVQLRKINGELYSFPDSVLGTDSHTTMVNGLGVLGWGVGGIEAEAVMLGYPYYFPLPEVIGVKLIGALQENVTSTDLVLTITEILRNHGVVGKFIEFYGPGIKNLTLPDRATISNMAPEYGATMGFFPIDEITLEYLKLSGRSENQIKLVEKYTKLQGLFLNEGLTGIKYSDSIEIDLSTIGSCIAGPKRPQDRIQLHELKLSFNNFLGKFNKKKKSLNTKIERNESVNNFDKLESLKLNKSNGRNKKIKEIKDKKYSNILELQQNHIFEHYTSSDISDGMVVIAAITSCTNTSNPSVLIGAGLLAKKAVEHGLKVKPYVKTSLAPGSRVVSEYLKLSGLIPYLEALGFHLVGYGCTTCIGNSGTLPEKVSSAIKENNLIVAGVISGNRNFEGRIHPLVKANYLASPLLVIVYALAGTIKIDLTQEPIGFDPNNRPVYLRDIWPSQEEIQLIMKQVLTSTLFKNKYSDIFQGTELWQKLQIPKGEIYEWNNKSTYIKEPPFFKNFILELPKISDIINARILALLGDSITTDHISPAGSIPTDGPAGKYLISHGVNISDFNSFGSRRGNHEVMIRGTFANIRLKNKLVPHKEGGWTKYIPTGEEMYIYDAAMKYKKENIPLIIFAGKEYGTGSSRDWAAKGTELLGVKAIIAESYERIHRSNLIGMGVLPLQFKNNENINNLNIKSDYLYDIIGIKEIKPNDELTVIMKDSDNNIINKFKVISRLDTSIEVEYFQNGGILQTVLRNILKKY